MLFSITLCFHFKRDRLPLHSQTGEHLREKTTKEPSRFVKLTMLPLGGAGKGWGRGSAQGRRNVSTFLWFITQIKSVTWSSRSSIVSFISRLLLNYNKVRSTTATRQDFPITSLFFGVCFPPGLLFSLQFPMMLHPHLPLDSLAHMHVLKPEAINTTGGKIYRMYLQTLKLFIYIYIFIYIRSIPREW